MATYRPGSIPWKYTSGTLSAATRRSQTLSRWSGLVPRYAYRTVPDLASKLSA